MLLFSSTANASTCDGCYFSYRVENLLTCRDGDFYCELNSFARLFVQRTRQLVTAVDLLTCRDEVVYRGTFFPVILSRIATALVEDCACATSYPFRDSVTSQRLYLCLNNSFYVLKKRANYSVYCETLWAEEF